MISRDVFLAVVKKEAAVIQHLLTVVPADAWDYRPTPAQRSTIELARYLAHTASAITVYALKGTWDHWEASEAKVKDLDPKAVAKAIAKQPAAVAKLLKPITDKKFAKLTVKDFDGKTVPLAFFLTRMVIGQLSAYRMQLFLYAKSAGNAGIGTSDCWLGRAAKKKAAEG